MAEHPFEDLFARLERERLNADRLYNDALTSVDRALGQLPRFPALPRPFDDTRVASLNQGWEIFREGAPHRGSGLKGRLRGFIWRMLGPMFAAQKEFNAALVDHINRNLAASRDAEHSAIANLDVVRRELEALASFESRLVQFLQTITAYVDTKDRSVGGSELRERLAMAEQRIFALKRELASGQAEPPVRPAETPDGLRGDRQPSGREAGVARDTSRVDPFGGAVDSLTYVGFEDRFRGSQDEIRGRMADYLPILMPASDVVDVGCGRGELIGLLVEHGVRARGVDMNPAMVELCRSHGLDVEHSDALSFLNRQDDGSIGGLVATQVVEHMEPAYLLEFLETASIKLRPGAPLILETINPACWMAFFDCYIRDLTHARPLHPDTLRYLVQASGFTQIEVQYRADVGPTDRLDKVPVSSGETPELTDIITALNAHADKLNARLFSSMDYAIVARR